MKITFLGTGTSHGVPPIDCIISGYANCRKNVCREALTDPKHVRSRCSLLMEYNGMHVLIDLSPDFRAQAIRERIPKIDAVLVTHKHADHIMGIPDIRSYTRMCDKPVDFYGSPETMEAIGKQFDYIFDPATFVGGGIPRIRLNAIEQPFELFGVHITPVPVVHGSLQGCVGFRIGNFAYIPDMKTLRSGSADILRDLDCLVLNCLRDGREHSTHLTLEQSVELARELAPSKCYFIHMAHDIHYVQDSAKLDRWMSFSWDGLAIEN